MMAGAHAASWFINGGKTPLKFGAISDWMEARDLPEADGESFRSWFKKHQAQEKKEWIIGANFLNNVAQALGRPLRLEPQAEDAPLNNYANERLYPT